MILSRPRLIPQERFDLEDLNALLSAARTDSKLFINEFWSNQNFILKGFTVTGLGLHTATLAMTDATLIIPQNTSDFSYFTSALSDPNITIPASSFVDGVRNYIELSLATENNTPLSRALWDPDANSGAGEEFNQIINTVTDLTCVPVVLTGGFSGLPDRLQLAIVDVDNSGVIRTIFDRRELFFRLGTPENIFASFSWATRVEPPYALQLTSTSGTFVAGETLSFASGATTATCTTGGTTSIAANIPSNDSWSYGQAVIGLTSGATGTVSSISESFSGADKNIQNERMILSALMSELKALKGTPFWFTVNEMSLAGLAQMINSCIFASTTATAPKFVWSGTYLQITDSNGSPLSTDVLGGINLIGSSQAVSFKRQDSQAGTTNISIGDGQVLFVQLPSSGNRSYSGVGSGATNYQVGNSSAFTKSDQNYWIAYRNGSVLYIRGQSELSTGESAGIGDSIPSTLLQNLGLIDEVTPAVYTSNIRGTNGESFVSRMSGLTDDVGDEQEDRSGYIRSDTPVLWDGTNLTFASDIILELVNTKSGTLTQHKILAANSPMAVSASGRSIYALITRTSASENITPVNSGVTPIPAQIQAQKDVFVFFRRIDVSGIAYLHVPFTKQLIIQGQSVRLGIPIAGTATTYIDALTLVDNSGPTAVSAFQFATASVSSEEIIYAIKTGTTNADVREGKIKVTCSAGGVQVTSLTDKYTESADCGVSWTASVSLGVVSVFYTATNQGFNRTMRIELKQFRA